MIPFGVDRPEIVNIIIKLNYIKYYRSLARNKKVIIENKVKFSVTLQ